MSQALTNTGTTTTSTASAPTTASTTGSASASSRGLLMSVLISPWLVVLSLRDLIAEAWHRRQLLREMTWRELADPFAGSFLGVTWSILHPLISMAVYAVVFLVIFRGSSETNRYGYDFGIQMISAYLPWMAFMQAVLTGCGAVRMKSGLVKQVVFPLEVLPLKTVAACMVPQIVGSVFLFVFTLVRFGNVPWTWVFWPWLMVCEALLLAGMVMAVSALGVYLRDLRDILQVVFLFLFYATPILYTEATFAGQNETVHTVIETMINCNPVSYYVWPFRDACYFGEFRHPSSWVIFPLVSLVIASVGYRVFGSLKPYFGNAL